jgi:hypothetical protein
MRLTRAQIKMSETIAVLIIFFFLLIFGFGFYTRVQKVTLAQETERNADLRGIAVAQKASFLPELQCTFRNIQTDNCFDKLKIQSFQEAMERKVTQDFYTQTFGFSTITLEQFALEGFDAINYTLYNNTKEESLVESTINIPVSIYDPLSRRYSFALLRVRSFG